MIKADNIIVQIKNKRRQRRRVPCDNVDNLINYPNLYEKQDRGNDAKTAPLEKEAHNESTEKTRIFKRILNTSTMSLAQEEEEFQIQHNNNYIPGKNRKYITFPTRASDNVDKTIPGDCDSFPAAGYWDWYGLGKLCFHTAYFVDRSEKLVECGNAENN